MIYLDHAATTPVRDEVLAVMLPYFSEKFANASGGYAMARDGRRAVDTARSQVAAAIGAKNSEIYFTSGGSESDNWALWGAASANPEKKHIITSKIEHHAVLNACQALEKKGYAVTYLDADELGRVSVQAFEKAIRTDTLLASVMLANNEVGTIEPVAQMATIARAHGVIMHTDAVQAVGHIPVDVDVLGVDMLSMSAHKFGGPKGCGALYVRSGLRLDNLIYGGAQERSMRAGTENVPAIAGMGKALELSVQNMAGYAQKVSVLRDELEKRLLGLEGVQMNGDRHNRLPGHLHVSFEGADTQSLLMRLDMAGIAAAAGSACSSGASARSHVLQAMGIPGEGKAEIRFSLGEENTMEEMAAVESVMRRILKR